MRYALVGDIHANLPALDAVLNAIDAGDFDGTFHLGDLVGYAPWPNEVIARLRERGVAGVSGNYDSTVASDYRHCGCRYEEARQEELSHLSYAWTRAHVTSESKSYLASLPFRLDFRPLGGHATGPTIILVHGTPLNNTTYWTEDRDDAFCAKMGPAAGARPGDLIAFGHTHKPWHRVVEGVHYVNAGSVGRPRDGDPRAAFGLIDIDSTGITDVRIQRVSYDIESAAQAIVLSDLPNEFAEQLR